ncbi:hypothetical protein VTO42DRAFT_6002 [Malbranchea cinnamomea]
MMSVPSKISEYSLLLYGVAVCRRFRTGASNLPEYPLCYVCLKRDDGLWEELKVPLCCVTQKRENSGSTHTAFPGVE